MIFWRSTDRFHRTISQITTSLNQSWSEQQIPRARRVLWGGSELFSPKWECKPDRKHNNRLSEHGQHIQTKLESKLRKCESICYQYSMPNNIQPNSAPSAQASRPRTRYGGSMVRDAIFTPGTEVLPPIGPQACGDCENKAVFWYSTNHRVQFALRASRHSGTTFWSDQRRFRISGPL